MDEKYIFTYDDYINLQNDVIMVCENVEDYQYESDVGKNNIYQKHDKSFKKALSDKEEMSKFLKQFIGIEVNENDLQEYKSEFITKDYERRQSDIVYRHKYENIYYLIEHQTKVDEDMPYRILEYCTEIIKSAIKSKGKKTYPIVVPIVLYTGSKRWNVERNFAERQKTKLGSYEEYTIELEYQLVDVNKYSEEKLLKNQTYVSNMMLMEKCKTNEEAIEMLRKIYKIEQNIEQLESITDYLLNLNKIIVPKDIIEELKRREGGDSMPTMLAQRIAKEYNEKYESGIKTGIKNVIEIMMNNNVDDKTIMKYTGVNKKELIEIKKELNTEL